jgi:hypothetical protein
LVIEIILHNGVLDRGVRCLRFEIRRGGVGHIECSVIWTHADSIGCEYLVSGDDGRQDFFLEIKAPDGCVVAPARELRDDVRNGESSEEDVIFIIFPVTTRSSQGARGIPK